MELLYKLKHAEQKYEGINISHEMMQKERTECKMLVAKAKQKQEGDTSGEYMYRVRGYPGQMKIIKLRIRQ